MKMFPSTCRISIGLHAFVIQSCLLAVATTPTPESSYCGSNLTHASCSRHDSNWNDFSCEFMMTRDNISPGDLFDKLMDGSNCSGEFILGKTGFNLTISIKEFSEYPNYSLTSTVCDAGFDPHRTWDRCSGLDRSCDYSVHVCDADRPGENCFTTNSTQVNGHNYRDVGSYYHEIVSVFVNGQLPCTRCLLQLRRHFEDGYSHSPLLPFHSSVGQLPSGGVDQPARTSRMRIVQYKRWRPTGHW